MPLPAGSIPAPRYFEEVSMKEWICEEVPAVTLDGKVLSTMLYQEQELVRCKDCRLFDTAFCPVNVLFEPRPDWFCADGELK